MNPSDIFAEHAPVFVDTSADNGTSVYFAHGTESSNHQTRVLFDLNHLVVQSAMVVMQEQQAAVEAGDPSRILMAEGARIMLSGFLRDLNSLREAADLAVMERGLKSE